MLEHAGGDPLCAPGMPGVPEHLAQRRNYVDPTGKVTDTTAVTRRYGTGFYVSRCGSWFFRVNRNRSETPLQRIRSFLWRVLQYAGTRPAHPRSVVFRKLDFLGRYAALYANKVMFPLPLSHPSKVDTVADSREELVQTALILLRLRRLIR
jgi:hypothetical protein